MFKTNDESLDLIFREARTHNVWLDKPVDDALLGQVYDLAKMGPTSANMCPMRMVFVKSKEAKEKLKPALDAGNVDKTMAAPGHGHHRHGRPFLRETAQTVPACGRQGVVQGPAGERAGIHGAAQLVASGRLLHAGGAVARAGLRADVRLRQRQGGCGVLRRHDRQIELPLQPRPRRREQALPAQPASAASRKRARSCEPGFHPEKHDESGADRRQAYRDMHIRVNGQTRHRDSYLIRDRAEESARPIDSDAKRQ